MTADISVPLGTRLKLHIPYLGEFDAVSVHRDAKSAGLRFVIDEWQQAGLVRDLTDLVASGPGPGKQAGGSPKSRQSREARGSGESAAAAEGASPRRGAAEDKAAKTRARAQS